MRRGCAASVMAAMNGKNRYRWGRTKGKLGFHGGKIELERPRVRARDGGEIALPSWEAVMAEDWLGKWALNLVLINVSTRKFGRAMRLPEGDVPAANGAGLSKSATSRRFVALSAERMKEWMASHLSKLELLVIQIDGTSRKTWCCWPPSASWATSTLSA
jgi:putative transposase